MSHTITQAQIAAFLGIIAVVLVYIAFIKNPLAKKDKAEALLQQLMSIFPV